jgi:hypothetical protein
MIGYLQELPLLEAIALIKTQFPVRVGHPVLLRSERTVLLRSFLERNVLFRSFFEFLATYETQKNDAFISVQLQ